MSVRVPLFCVLCSAASGLGCDRPDSRAAGGAGAQSTSASSSALGLAVAPTVHRQRPARDGDDPPLPARPPADNAPRVRLSQILIAYQGAVGARPSVTRSKEAARALAEHLDIEARAGADFAGLADKYSDDASVGRNHGDLGLFTRAEAAKAPAVTVAFGLISQEIAVVPLETPAGFQVIKRTE